MAKLDPDTKIKIGQHLRAIYDSLVEQGVPDRYAEILLKFDHADAEAETKSEGGGLMTPNEPVRGVTPFVPSIGRIPGAAVIASVVERGCRR